MLLVDDDHAQVGYGREDRRPGADDDARLARGDAGVLGAAPGRGDAAVEDGDRVTEAGGEARGGLRRERDLRHEHDRAPPALQGGIDRAQVDLGLARPRDAVHEDVAAAGRKRLGAGAHGRLLIRRERHAHVVGRGARGRVEGDQPARGHPPHRLARRPGRCDQVGQRQRRQADMFEHLGLSRRGALHAHEPHPGIGCPHPRGRRDDQGDGPRQRRGVRGGDPLGEGEQRLGDRAVDAHHLLQALLLPRAHLGHDPAHRPRPELDLHQGAARDRAGHRGGHGVVERVVDGAGGDQRMHPSDHDLVVKSTTTGTPSRPSRRRSWFSTK